MASASSSNNNNNSNSTGRRAGSPGSLTVETASPLSRSVLSSTAAGRAADAGGFGGGSPSSFSSPPRAAGGGPSAASAPPVPLFADAEKLFRSSRRRLQLVGLLRALHASPAVRTFFRADAFATRWEGGPGRGADIAAEARAVVDAARRDMAGAGGDGVPDRVCPPEGAAAAGPDALEPLAGWALSVARVAVLPRALDEFPFARPSSRAATSLALTAAARRSPLEGSGSGGHEVSPAGDGGGGVPTPEPVVLLSQERLLMSREQSTVFLRGCRAACGGGGGGGGRGSTSALDAGGAADAVRFYYAVEELARGGESAPASLDELVAEFVADGAPSQVPLSASTRERLLSVTRADPSRRDASSVASRIELCRPALVHALRQAWLQIEMRLFPHVLGRLSRRAALARDILSSPARRDALLDMAAQLHEDAGALCFVELERVRFSATALEREAALAETAARFRGRVACTKALMDGALGAARAERGIDAPGPGPLLDAALRAVERNLVCEVVAAVLPKFLVYAPSEKALLHAQMERDEALNEELGARSFGGAGAGGAGARAGAAGASPCTAPLYVLATRPRAGSRGGGGRSVSPAVSSAIEDGRRPSLLRAATYSTISTSASSRHLPQHHQRHRTPDGLLSPPSAFDDSSINVPSSGKAAGAARTLLVSASRLATSTPQQEAAAALEDTESDEDDDSGLHGGGRHLFRSLAAPPSADAAHAVSPSPPPCTPAQPPPKRLQRQQQQQPAAQQHKPPLQRAGSAPAGSMLRAVETGLDSGVAREGVPLFSPSRRTRLAGLSSLTLKPVRGRVGRRRSLPGQLEGWEREALAAMASPSRSPSASRSVSSSSPSSVSPSQSISGWRGRRRQRRQQANNPTGTSPVPGAVPEEGEAVLEDLDTLDSVTRAAVLSEHRERARFIDKVDRMFRKRGARAVDDLDLERRRRKVEEMAAHFPDLLRIRRRFVTDLVVVPAPEPFVNDAADDELRSLADALVHADKGGAGGRGAAAPPFARALSAPIAGKVPGSPPPPPPPPEEEDEEKEQSESKAAAAAEGSDEEESIFGSVVREEAAAEQKDVEEEADKLFAMQMQQHARQQQMRQQAARLAPPAAAAAAPAATRRKARFEISERAQEDGKRVSFRAGLAQVAHVGVYDHAFVYETEDPDGAEPMSPPSAMAKGRQPSRGILKAVARIETFAEALERVMRERDRESAELLDLLRQGAWVKKYNSLGASDRRYLWVSPDGTELHWSRQSKHARRAAEQGAGGQALTLQRTSSWFGFSAAVRTRLLADVQHMRYGTYYSARFSRRNHKAKAPWLGFSLFFEDRTLDFVFKDEQTTDAFFLGVQSLVPLTQDYLSRGALLWTRAKMKVEYRACQLGVPERDVWDGLLDDARRAVRKGG